MTGSPKRYCFFFAVLAFSFAAARLTAGDLYKSGSTPETEVALPKASDIKSIDVYPTKMTLKGADDTRQLIVTATLKGGRLQDLSSDVKYGASDGRVIRVTKAGRVIPLANGKAEISVSYGDKTTKVSAVAHDVDVNL